MRVEPEEKDERRQSGDRCLSSDGGRSSTQTGGAPQEIGRHGQGQKGNRQRSDAGMLQLEQAKHDISRIQPRVERELGGERTLQGVEDVYLKGAPIPQIIQDEGLECLAVPSLKSQWLHAEPDTETESEHRQQRGSGNHGGNDAEVQGNRQCQTSSRRWRGSRDPLNTSQTIQQ